jgi:hypothetical protein
MMAPELGAFNVAAKMAWMNAKLAVAAVTSGNLRR